MHPLFMSQPAALPAWTAENYLIVVDGNSHFAGSAPEFNIPNLSNSSGFEVAKIPISGQTFDDMIANSSDLVQAINNTHKHIALVTWDGTNAITAGQNATQTLQDLADYSALARGLSPDLIHITATTIPRRQSTNIYTVDQLNAEQDAYNAAIKANPSAYGVDYVADIRKDGSRLNLPDYSLASFATLDDWWRTGEQSTDATSVHLNGTGYAATIYTELNNVFGQLAVELG